MTSRRSPRRRSPSKGRSIQRRGSPVRRTYRANHPCASWDVISVQPDTLIAWNGDEIMTVHIHKNDQELIARLTQAVTFHTEASPRSYSPFNPNSPFNQNSPLTSINEYSPYSPGSSASSGSPRTPETVPSEVISHRFVEELRIALKQKDIDQIVNVIGSMQGVTINNTRTLKQLLQELKTNNQ